MLERCLAGIASADSNFTVLNTHGHYTEKEEAKAIEMAIASLEAWEKVKAEIDESRDALKTMTEGEWFAGKLKGLDCAVAIIDKHLQEVEE